MNFEIESHAEGHAHSYQLGQGRQLNVEHMYLSHQDSMPFALSPTLLGPLVRESDPLELGVHRAAMSNGNAVPLYVPRDIDYDFQQMLAEIVVSGGFVLVEVIQDCFRGLSFVALFMGYIDQFGQIVTDKAEHPRCFIS